MANKSFSEHIIDIGKRTMDYMGDAPGGGGKGGKGKNEKNLAQQLKRLAGIDLGLGALLKQSQIFTGYMGNLFAIVGAIIDTVLAPLAPLAFKALAALGKKIPAISAMAEKHIPKIVDRVTKIVQGVDGFIKKFWTTWTRDIGFALAAIMAINLSLKFIRMSGNMAMSVTGARGIVGGVSKLMGRGGPVSQAASGGNVMTGGMGQFGGGMRTGINLGAKATSMGSRFATASRLAGRGVPIIGTAVAAGFTYSDSRNKGMSKGQSMARTGSTIAGGAIGAGIGSLIAPGIGTVAGGALGAMVGPMIFDALFGKKGGGGGGSSNLNVGGGAGMAGYRVPTFVAQSAEAASEGVNEKGFVLDEGFIDLKVQAEIEKLGLLAGKTATDVGDLGTSAAAAALLVTGSMEDLSSRFYQFSMYNKDDPDDTGTGGASNKYGLFKDPNIETPAQKTARLALEARVAELNAIINADSEDAAKKGKDFLGNNFNASLHAQTDLETANADKAAGLDRFLGDLATPEIQDAIAMSGGTVSQSDYTSGKNVGESQGDQGAGLVVNVSFIQQQGIEKAQAAKIGSAWAHVVYGGEENGGW